jgi:signal transduction histidine kinase
MPAVAGRGTSSCGDAPANCDDHAMDRRSRVAYRCLSMRYARWRQSVSHGFRGLIRARAARRYGFAVLAPLAAAGARVALDPLVGARVQFTLLLLATVVVAWYAGRGPALVAVAIGALAALTFLAPPVGTPVISDPADVFAVILFLVPAILVIFVAAGARERSVALEGANGRLQRALDENRGLLRVRDAFASMLAHELRTPITVIIGDARLLRRWAERADAERPIELLDDLTAETERLHRIVEDLLVLNRGEGRLELNLQPVLLQHLVPSVAERSAGGLSRVEVRLPAGLPPVSADPTFVEQIVRNLVNNAGKYAGPGATVVISGQSRGGTVSISVADDGPGFPAEDTDRLFELFFRSARASGSASGAGIGLHIVRRLVEAMDGSIEAANGPDGGSVFTFTLPVDPDVLEHERETRRRTSETASLPSPTASSGA